MTESVDYYNQNAQAFYSGTVNVDMASLYQRFLPLLPNGGRILDAGCGSGRDALFFKQAGFDVTAFDASEKLAEMAANLIGDTVAVLRFQAIDWVEQFDGIWACASLLHVSDDELLAVFNRLFLALKSEGVLYCSFKYGEQKQRNKEGRTFTDMTEEAIALRLTQLPFNLVWESWLTEDLRPGRNEQWLNLIIRKGDTPPV